MSWGSLRYHLNNTIGNRNGVLMCTILTLLKTPMEGFHLKLVKDILRKFQNSDFICGSLFGILIIIRPNKILVNQKHGWGLHTPPAMKCDTILIHIRKIQITSSYQSPGLDVGTLGQKRSTHVERWHWTYNHIQILLTSTHNMDNGILVKSPWWFKINGRGSEVLRTNGNIRIYCPRVFRVMSGINQSYSSEHDWEILSPSSTWKAKWRTLESK